MRAGRQVSRETGSLVQSFYKRYMRRLDGLIRGLIQKLDMFFLFVRAFDLLIAVEIVQRIPTN